MEKFVGEKISENLDFVEHSIFIRTKIKLTVWWCPGINSQEIPIAEFHYSKLSKLKPVNLLQ